MRLILIFGFFALIYLLPSSVFAQEATEADTVDMGILLRKEMSGNVLLHTLGYGVGYRIGTNKNYFKSLMFDFDFIEMRAPNQYRRYNENYAHPRGYFYGKLNNLYILHAGIGEQFLLNRKPYWGGVELRGFYYGGFSLGIARPVYLYIAYYTVEDNVIMLDHLSLEKYDPDAHFPYIGQNASSISDIYGRGPILSGFNKIKPYPGIYAKGGFNFDFSALNDRIKALEVGVTVDIFPKAVPIMAFSDPYRFFLTAYLSFHFGKRYN